MKFSTKTRYGVRAMIELALNFNGTPISLKDIAEKQDISEKYLEQIMLILKKAGFVESIQGTNGGFILINKPSEIKLSEIVEVLEGGFSPVACVDKEILCKKSKVCSARNVWIKVKNAIKDILDSITLEQLVEEEKKKQSIYYI